MRRRPLFIRPNLEEPPENPPPDAPSNRPLPPDDRRPAFQTPVVTYALIAVNVAMWLVTTAVATGPWRQRLLQLDPATLLLFGAKVGPLIHAGQYWRLVTACFLHAGLFHLAVNMWALLQLGTLCEVLYGRARFLILYVCSGVMGTFASYELTPQFGVGASGAIFGLLGVALVYSIKYRRELPPGMGDRMRRSLTPVLLLNLAITLTIRIIDKGAHLGGLISGALLAALIESKTASAEGREREIVPVPLALLTAIGLLGYGAWGLGSSFPVTKALLVANAAAQRGDTNGAIRTLYRAMERRPNDTAAREELTSQLIGLLLKRQRWADAEREFLALARAPLAPESILPLGLEVATALTQARQGVEAEAVYRRLLELDPNEPELLNSLAYLYADVLETHLSEAEQMAQKALEAPPNQGIIGSLLMKSELDQARGQFLDTLAWVYFKEGKLADASTTQQKALGLLGNDATMRFHMGAIEERLGHLPAARHEYEMALRLDPKFAPARQALLRLKAAS